MTAYTLKIRGGCEVDRYGKRAGKGPLVQREMSGTLGVSQDQTLIVIGEKTKAYGIDHAIMIADAKSTAQGPCIYDELCPTIKSMGPHGVIVLKE